MKCTLFIQNQINVFCLISFVDSKYKVYHLMGNNDWFNLFVPFFPGLCPWNPPDFKIPSKPDLVVTCTTLEIWNSISGSWLMSFLMLIWQGRSSRSCIVSMVFCSPQKYISSFSLALHFGNIVTLVTQAFPSHTLQRTDLWLCRHKKTA